MSENTNSGLDAATAFFANMGEDSSGAPRAQDSNRTVEVEGDEPEAQEDEAVTTPGDADEAEPATDENSTSDQDDTDGEPDEGDDGIADGSTSEDADDKEAERGRLRFEDYTRKTQELGKDRKALEEERAVLHSELESIRQERARYAEYLPLLAQITAGPQTTEADLEYIRANHPDQYANAYIDHQRALQRHAGIEAEKQRLAQIEAAEQAESTKAYLAAEREALLQKRPEWQDQKVFKDAQKNMRTFARDVLGYSEEDLNQAYDHRAVLALADAMETHRARNIKAEPAKSSAARVAPGAVSASPRKSNARDEAFKRQRNSGGTISSTADALKHLI